MWLRGKRNNAQPKKQAGVIIIKKKDTLTRMETMQACRSKVNETEKA